jgi:hypothetical protein
MAPRSIGRSRWPWWADFGRLLLGTDLELQPDAGVKPDLAAPGSEERVDSAPFIWVASRHDATFGSNAKGIRRQDRPSGVHQFRQVALGFSGGAKDFLHPIDVACRKSAPICRINDLASLRLTLEVAAIRQ